MFNDLYNNSKELIGLDFQTFASDTATAGNIIDTQGFGSGKVNLALGAVTAGEIAITKIQESDDSGMSGATDIPSARLIGSFVTLDTADTITAVGFVSTLRYVQVTYTTADTATGLVTGSIVELGSPHNASTR